MIADRLISKVLDLLRLLVLVNVLTPADFGLVAMGLMLVQFIEAAFELPVAQALLRLKNPDRAAFDTAFTLGFLRGVMISCMLIVLAWPLAAFYGQPQLYGLVLGLTIAPVSRGMLNPRLTEFHRQMDFRWHAVIEVTGTLASLIMATAVAITTGSYWALVVGAAINPVVTTILSYVVAPFWPRLSLSAWRDFADFIGWKGLSQLIKAFTSQLDKFVLGCFVSPVSLGRFSVAESISVLVRKSIIEPISQPIFAALVNLTTKYELRRAYLKASNIMLIIAAPWLVILAVLAEIVVRMVFGDQWAEMAVLLRWMAVSNIIGMLFAPTIGLAIILHKTKFETLHSTINILTKLPALLLGIWWFGVLGVVGASILANSALLITRLYISRNILSISIKDQLYSCSRVSLALFSMVFSMGLLDPFPNTHDSVLVDFGFVLLTSSIGCATFLLTLFSLWILAGRPEEAEFTLFRQVKTYCLSVKKKFLTAC
ncbi:MAG: oligosaccharide flippase family protein [Myxococcales bacterium]|nr:oligosaccharide flippase family protein [Myxococcales bacterium]